MKLDGTLLTLGVVGLLATAGVATRRGGSSNSKFKPRMSGAGGWFVVDENEKEVASGFPDLHEAKQWIADQETARAQYDSRISR